MIRNHADGGAQLKTLWRFTRFYLFLDISVLESKAPDMTRVYWIDSPMRRVWVSSLATRLSLSLPSLFFAAFAVFALCCRPIKFSAKGLVGN